MSLSEDRRYKRTHLTFSNLKKQRVGRRKRVCYILSMTILQFRSQSFLKSLTVVRVRPQAARVGSGRVPHRFSKSFFPIDSSHSCCFSKRKLNLYLCKFSKCLHFKIRCFKEYMHYSLHFEIPTNQCSEWQHIKILYELLTQRIQHVMRNRNLAVVNINTVGVTGRICFLCPTMEHWK